MLLSGEDLTDEVKKHVASARIFSASFLNRILASVHIEQMRSPH
jgi:hypothetical protein